MEKRRNRNFRDSEGFIRKALELEIVKRYVYRSGLYKYSLENDDAILSARELMEDVKHYASILK
jgi:carboxyl-terminal processing protease